MTNPNKVKGASYERAVRLQDAALVADRLVAEALAEATGAPFADRLLVALDAHAETTEARVQAERERCIAIIDNERDQLARAAASPERSAADASTRRIRDALLAIGDTDA